MKFESNAWLDCEYLAIYVDATATARVVQRARRRGHWREERLARCFHGTTTDSYRSHFFRFE